MKIEKRCKDCNVLLKTTNTHQFSLFSDSLEKNIAIEIWACMKCGKVELYLENGDENDSSTKK